MIEDHVNDSKKYYVKLQRNKNELLRQRMPYESTNSIVLGCCCSFHKLNREEVINWKSTGLKKYNANAKVAENKRVDMVS